MHRPVAAEMARADQGQARPYGHASPGSWPGSPVRRNHFKAHGCDRLAKSGRLKFGGIFGGRVLSPFHTALYELCDPILLRRAGAGELRTKVHWFDPNRPAQAEPESDWWVEIYDGRFVGITYGPKHAPVIFGDLRDDGAHFVGWVPLHRKNQFVGCAIEKLAREFGREKLAEAVAAWEDPTRWPHELRDLGYRYEQHGEDDPLRTTAAATVKSPLFTTNINISLAIRKALRRYLRIEPAERRIAVTGGGLAACPLVNRRRGQRRFELFGCKDGSDEKHKTSQHLARGLRQIGIRSTSPGHHNSSFA